jgi:hypothetical protein
MGYVNEACFHKPFKYFHKSNDGYQTKSYCILDTTRFHEASVEL